MDVPLLDIVDGARTGAGGAVVRTGDPGLSAAPDELVRTLCGAGDGEVCAGMPFTGVCGLSCGPLADELEL